MEEILGYKCFDEKMRNSYGRKFKVGNIYIDNGTPSFGAEGYGFHMCKNFEDTLRYFNAITKEINICLVNGSGKIIKGYDDYNEYYDMYSVEKIKIIKQLTRTEIIELALNLDCVRVKRFIMNFKLTKEEIIRFKEKFYTDNEVIAFIEYYQEEKIDVFINKTKKLSIKR